MPMAVLNITVYQSENNKEEAKKAFYGCDNDANANTNCFKLAT